MISFIFALRKEFDYFSTRTEELRNTNLKIHLQVHFFRQ